MSFLDSVVNMASSAWGWATGGSTSAGVARAAALAYMLRQVQKSINKDNDSDTGRSDSDYEGIPSPPDPGVREQVDPDTENTIPVIYGQAHVGPRVIDAAMTNNNGTMWYALTICEQTGPHMSTGLPSKIDFLDVFWNSRKLNFGLDGFTVASMVDADGNVDENPKGLVRVYVYSGGSTSPVRILGKYGDGNSSPAYNLMPNWTTDHAMSDLVFAIVSVDYSKEKNVTGLGTMEFKIRNSLVMAGDCLYDYMTNSRYGAGIPPEEINQ